MKKKFKKNKNWSIMGKIEHTFLLFWYHEMLNKIYLKKNMQMNFWQQKRKKNKIEFYD